MNGVLVTGAAGGVGLALCAAFREAGWRVVGVDDREAPACEAHRLIRKDLAVASFDDLAADARDALEGAPLAALVNNAAVQRLAPTEAVTQDDWEQTLRVNLTAPLRLTQAFLPDLEAAGGTVINIGSVHAQATKPGFVAYATSKAALHGLTRALAVDLGPRVRVVCLAPAAVNTPMLAAGFADQPDAFAELARTHPVGRLAEPREIARAAVALTGEPFLFATGAIFWLDGGVLSRLHDPA